MDIDRAAFNETLAAATDRLLAARRADGHWTGELSSSALSTATAVTALSLVDADLHRALIARGGDWLGEHRNADGGWGDTTVSKSNLATTLLVWSALALAGDQRAAVAAGAEAWLKREAGSLEPEALAAAIDASYGQDRTFSAPILTMAALTGRLGEGRDAWRWVYPLPFELAACPHRLLKWLRLPVVSYALPALIAVGQVRHHHLRPVCAAARLVRRLAAPAALRKLERIQPESGGFLEAAPLTSFVAASLAAMDRRDHPAARRGVEFLVGSVLPDGSWPIDTNLATWVTTLAVKALSVGGDAPQGLDAAACESLRTWLLDQQHRVVHPYTNAEPGGWAWTDLSGGVPDADDTPGALLALRCLGPVDDRARDAAAAGVKWLCDVQNRDGGIPTFCRGWGKLPFDRSSPDLTAHALHALRAWRADLPAPITKRAARAIGRMSSYLRAAQRRDGSWAPLWFGNEHAAGQENPVYGAARAVLGLGSPAGDPPVEFAVTLGCEFLLDAQHPDGGWGGDATAPASIEETALAVDALASIRARCRDSDLDDPASIDPGIAGGVRWLIDHTGRGTRFEPTPIGLYFAKLWYFERLYPLIFTVSALRRVHCLRGQATRAHL